jgi:hypothetical protein
MAMKWVAPERLPPSPEGELSLFSRNQRPITHSYPELANLPALLRGRDIMLDGEIVALDQTGRPRFGLLQERMHIQGPHTSLTARVPVDRIDGCPVTHRIEGVESLGWRSAREVRLRTCDRPAWWALDGLVGMARTPAA